LRISWSDFGAGDAANGGDLFFDDFAIIPSP
jgi:hypothetical protein